MVRKVRVFAAFILTALAVSVPAAKLLCNKSNKVSVSVADAKISDAGQITEEHNDSDTSESWKIILVNSSNPIPENYKIELMQLDNGVSVDKRIYQDLQLMFDDMRNHGIFPIVGEGYRTREEQSAMMQDKISAYINEGYDLQEAQILAEKLVAKPGTSEHELGLALDINADTELSDNITVYNWLCENAYKYGFILRYPKGKEYITGIDYEPWHYRYVGRETAEEMFNEQLTLEEFYGIKDFKR